MGFTSHTSTLRWLPSALFLLGQLAGVLGGYGDLEGLLAVPGHDQSTLDMATLKTGRTIEGTLEKDESRVVWFAGEKRDGRFPDFLLMLLVLNRHGDADIHCAPAPWLESMGLEPSPVFYAWKSIHSQDTDELFLSAKSRVYQGAEMAVENRNDTIAAFACAITGVAWEPTRFRFDLDISYSDRKLVPEEVGAIKGIYESCCSEAGSCGPWKSNATETNEDNFVASDGHNVEVDFCHRLGSLCSSDGHLMRLDMRNFGLECEFPVDHIAKMTRLVKLDMDGNFLRGDVAEIVGKVGGNDKMKRLSLRRNSIGGRLDGLESYCDAFQPGRLSYLDLSENKIEGSLVSCMFKDPSNGDGQASGLLELRLKKNMLSGGIPDAFTSSSDLETLTLQDNRISGRLPESMGKLKHMRVLDVQYNQMSGPIPDNIGNIQALYMLAGTGNFFTNLPPSWSRSNWQPPSRLKLVEMGQNDLEGEFPVGLGNSATLLGLDLGQNQLSGSIVVEEGQFGSLLLLNISFNAFDGTIPEGLGDIKIFKDLRSSAIPTIQPTFDMRNNRFTGEVPNFFYPSVSPAITKSLVFLSGNKGLTCDNPDELSYTGVTCRPDEDDDYAVDADQSSDWEEPVPYEPPVQPSQPRYLPATPVAPTPRRTGYQSSSRSASLTSSAPNQMASRFEDDAGQKKSSSKASVWGGVIITLLLVIALVVGVVVFKRVKQSRSTFGSVSTYAPPEEEGFGYALMERPPRDAEERAPLTAPTSQ